MKKPVSKPVNGATAAKPASKSEATKKPAKANKTATKRK